MEVNRMSRNITRFVASLFVLGLALGLTNSVRAQETGKDEIIRPLTKQGSAAFIFTLNGLGDFKIGSPSINGMTSGVGVKYFLADEMALRVLLGFNSSTSGGLIGADSAKTLSTSIFGILAGIEMHFRPLYSTSPYVGLQVGFSSKSEDITTTTTQKTTAFSVMALAGFDWFFTHGIAAGAEMGLGFTSNGGTKVNGADVTSTSSITLATNPDVHVVVYF
jgi:hypothetical protein